MYTLKVTNNDNGCSNEASVTVSLDQQAPIADAGEDATINCENSSATLGTDPVNGYQYSWSPTLGLDNPNSANPTATPTSDQTYTLTVTNSSNGCTASDTVNVTVDTDIDEVTMPKQYTIKCQQPVQIGTDPVSGMSYQWTPADKVSQADIANPTVSHLDIQNNYQAYTLTITASNGCSRNYNIEVFVEPVVLEINAPNDRNLEGCATNYVAIINQSLDFNFSETTVTLTPDQIDTFSNLNGASYSSNCQQSISYIDQVQNSGCRATITRTYTITNSINQSKQDAQSIIVQTDQKPVFISQIPQDTTIDCQDAPQPPDIQAKDACETTLDAVLEEQYNYINPNTTELIRTWTATDACNKSVTKSQTITLTTYNESEYRATGLCVTDPEFNLNSLFEDLNANQNNWINTQDQTEVGATILPSNFQLGNHHFSYTYTDGNCQRVYNATITIHDLCVDYPCLDDSVPIKGSSLVTPNNDFNNDSFKVNFKLNPQNTRPCDVKVHLQIFNRWGTLVYQNKDYQNNWKGQNNNYAINTAELLPTATYYYIIKLVNTNKEPIQGFFLLKRK